MEKKRGRGPNRPTFISNHYFMVIKLTCTLLVVSLFQVSAAVYSQNTEINLRFEKAKITTVIKAIERQLHFNYRFVYNADEFPSEYRVSINAVNIPLSEALNELLKGTGYQHRLSGDELIVLSPIGKETPQNREVTGKVTDKNGAPLAGVSVLVKGTTNGTTTDPEGHYRLEALEHTTLEFSYLGYLSKEVIVGNQSTIDIFLEASDNSLDEVVIVGYGSQRRRDIIGAVSSINTEQVQEKPVHRVEQALIGQLPGVQVRQQTSIPGQGLSILVRGSGSINAGNDPLYVIDGFPLDVVGQSANGSYGAHPLSNLNPADIESIQVLKDAAAGAIYGSRAANGVVIVTTKKGKTGTASISLNANTGVSQVARKLDLLSAEEWVEVASEMADINWVRSGTGRTADQTNDQRRSILGLAEGEYNISYMADERWSQEGHPGLQYVDWQDAVYRNGLFQNYSLSANGASQNTNYFISGNYLNQQGTLINTDYKNYGLRANVETKAKDRLKLGINLAPSYSESNTPTQEGKDTPIMNMALMAPVVEADAGLNTGAGEFSTYKWSSDRLVSPYAVLNNTIGLTKNTRILGTAYAEYELFPGASVRTSVNYDDINEQYKYYVSDYVAVGGAAARETNPGLNASGSYEGFRKQNFVNENTLRYSGTFKEKHTFSAIAGLSYNWVHLDNFGLNTAGGFNNNIVNTLNNAMTNSSGITVEGSTTENTNTLFSYYGRVQYDYDNRYLLSGTLRRDGSSKFGANYKWGTFPSLSVGWRISDESFLKNVKAINDLKLRLSWGKSGNDNIGNYNFISTLSSSTYSFGGNSPVSAAGQVASGIANPNLKWETSDTYNLGLDVYLLQNRLSLVVDAYTKTTKDLLLNLPVVGTSGFSSSLQNIGSVKNKGLEIALQSVNIKKGDFEWSTKANIAFNKNEVISLNEDASAIYIPSAYSGSNAPYVLAPGLPLYSYYVTKTQGILTQADIDDPNVAKISGQTVGDTKYQDTDGNGTITADDRVIYGHPNPDYTWGITNSFRYKNWDLSVQVYGQQGGKILSYFGRAVDFSGSTSANILGLWRDRWTEENQNYDAKRGKLGGNYTVPNVTSDWIYSSDFWRIQDITIGYNFGKKSQKSFLNNARIYISLQNWFGQDKYEGGANPEAQNSNVSGDSSYSIPGDYGSLPINKTAAFGLNLSF
ncbi:TonB-dependent receptor [Sphingobacterium sp. LRF_L2]|uniref:TonB-dependent receptor n=1 Tax=Sphingobacterium sp. LRF_L2 TaxID=3369421 RepID=UPI003F609420